MKDKKLRIASATRRGFIKGYTNGRKSRLVENIRDGLNSLHSEHHRLRLGF
jgi:hypothetical protein